MLHEVIHQHIQIQITNAVTTIEESEGIAACLTKISANLFNELFTKVPCVLLIFLC